MEVTEVTYHVQANPLSLQTLQDLLHLSKNSLHPQSVNQNESIQIRLLTLHPINQTGMTRKAI
jgi:hypothetical protein